MFTNLSAVQINRLAQRLSEAPLGRSASVTAAAERFERLLAAKDVVMTAIRQRRVYSQTVAELTVLTDRELSDLGISRLGIAEIAREAAYGK